MKYCIIDIGTNTVKMSLYETSDGTFETVLHKSMRCSLGLCLTDGKLNDEGISRLCKAVEEYTALAHENKCENIYAIATQSLRNCTNAYEVCETVKQRYNVDIDVISGEDEAFYSYSSLLLTDPEAKSGISVDLGGGSCELVQFDVDGIDKSESFPFGVLSLTPGKPSPSGGRCQPIGLTDEGIPPTVLPDEGTNEQHEAQVKQYVHETVNGFSAKELFAIGGTARGIFKLYSILHENTHSLSLDELKELYNEIKTLDGGEELLKKELPQRYDSIPTGFCVFIALMETCGCERMTLCTAGVREGYLAKKVLKK